MLKRLAGGLQGKALDYGCGYGDVTYAFARELNIQGVDVDAERVRFARDQYPEITFEECEPERTAFSSDQFDVVISSVVLPFVPDIRRYLAEVNRILKFGGTFIVANKNSEVLWEACRRLLRKPPLQSTSPEGLRALLEQQGFRIERSDYFFDPPFDSIKNIADVGLSAVQSVASLLRMKSLAEYYGFRAVKAGEAPTAFHLNGAAESPAIVR